MCLRECERGEGRGGSLPGQLQEEPGAGVPRLWGAVGGPQGQRRGSAGRGPRGGLKVDVAGTEGPHRAQPPSLDGFRALSCTPWETTE